MLTTERLRLRQWTADDLAPFAKLNSDPQVMEHFPKCLTRKESDALAQRIISLIDQRGWGFWAVEILDNAQFIGFVGLHTPSNAMPFSPCVEIGWRLHKTYWGKGYATEAAKAALDYGFSQLDQKEIVAFTTVANQRSQAVMKKLGMTNTGENFMHPDIDPNHPQCEHVLFKITRPT